eukprot:TRINITY_DN1667_c0_g1_i1.p1 TRINITY_DN1667_c0_g1~~TRINITY_DN1667_c0_g1_i1.p1  ORF type:complete len:380 (-),score=145.06 TRINITY_DN1667_c0_g1_i1:69-1208(-)
MTTDGVQLSFSAPSGNLLVKVLAALAGKSLSMAVPVTEAADEPSMVFNGDTFVGVQKIAAALSGTCGFAADKKPATWVDFVASKITPNVNGEYNTLRGGFGKINSTALTSVFLTGNVITVADAVVFAAVYPIMARFTVTERVSFSQMARWFNHIQHLPEMKGVCDMVEIPLVMPDIAVEKKEKKADVPAGAKTEKKQKPKKEKKPQAPAAPEQSQFSKLDIRVGKIVDVKKHEAADKLYVETIDLGEESGPRTIVSGLVHFVPIEEMQNRMVMVLCNLKPCKMVGVASAGMVLCAGSDDHTQVEVMDVPEGAKVGDRFTCEGYEDGAPLAVLPPKKKIFEAVAPDFKTDANCVSTYKGVVVKCSSGPATSKSLSNVCIA